MDGSCQSRAANDATAICMRNSPVFIRNIGFVLFAIHVEHSEYFKRYFMHLSLGGFANHAFGIVANIERRAYICFASACEHFTTGWFAKTQFAYADTGADKSSLLETEGELAFARYQTIFSMPLGMKRKSHP